MEKLLQSFSAELTEFLLKKVTTDNKFDRPLAQGDEFQLLHILLEKPSINSKHIFSIIHFKPKKQSYVETNLSRTNESE